MKLWNTKDKERSLKAVRTQEQGTHDNGDSEGLELAIITQKTT